MKSITLNNDHWYLFIPIVQLKHIGTCSSMYAVYWFKDQYLKPQDSLTQLMCTIDFKMIDWSLTFVLP